MLSIDQINFKYKSKNILENINIEAKEGKVIAFVGPNGAGKSTLLSYIANELEPKNNLIKLNGKLLKDWNRKLLTLHKAKFSQHQQTNITLTVKEIVMMGRYPYFKNLPSEEDYKIIDFWMNKTNTFHLKDRNFSHLSGGEQQRVHLARVFSQLENDYKKKILLLDEPLNNLDVSHQFRLLENLREFALKGNLVILVIHDLNLASQFADEIVLMDKGKIVCHSSPENVLRSEIISKVYDFPCVVCNDPIMQKPCVIFGRRNTGCVIKETQLKR